MHAPAVTFEVAQRFHGLRYSYLAHRTIYCVGGALAVLASVWLVLAACDYVWEWPLAVRRMLFAIAFASVALATCIALARALVESGTNAFAGRLENQFDAFGQRLRTVLQVAEGRLQAPEAMLAALGNQTLGRWETATPSQIVPVRLAIASVTVAGILGLASASGLLSTSDWRTALMRAAGLDRLYAIASVTPGNTKLLEGSSLTLSMKLEGRPQPSVVVRYRKGAEANWIESELLPTPSEPQALASGSSAQPSREPQALAAVSSAQPSREPQALAAVSSAQPSHEPQALAAGSALAANTKPAAPSQDPTRLTTFSIGLGKLSEPIEYQFLSKTGPSEIYRIDVQPLIVAEKIVSVVTPPAYTQLEARNFSGSDVTVLAGSIVNVTLATNQPLAESSLEIGEKANQLAASEVKRASDANTWTFPLPSEHSLYWRFSGKGKDGTPMAPVAGRLRIRQDGEPRIDWREPDDNVKVHMLTELPMRVQIADDYGLTQAAIVIQLGDEEPVELASWSVNSQPKPIDSTSTTNHSAAAESPPTQELSQHTTAPRTQLRLGETLPLESFALTEHDFVTYFAYAIDNRQGNPQRIESDVRYIDIRPLRQYWSERDLVFGGGGGGVFAELDEIIRRQRYIVNRTRKMTPGVIEKSSRDLTTLERITASQSELADLTRFLAEFFAERSRDDAEALSQAEVAMLQAADSLSVASLPIALQREHDALRSLAEARNTIERTIARNARTQNQEFQQFRRQLRQRMRQSPQDNDRQLADSLAAIAADERLLARDAAQSLIKPNENTSSSRPLPDDSKSTTPVNTNQNEKSSEVNSDRAEQQVASNNRDTSSATATESTSETKVDVTLDFQARQQGLLDRLQQADDEMSAVTRRSKLVEQRLKDAIETMDKLVGDFRTSEVAAAVQPARDLSDDLDELSDHIRALSDAEPSSRVSALRDLMTSITNLENESSRLAHELVEAQRAGALPQAADGNSSIGNSSNGNSSNGGAPAVAARTDRSPDTMRQRLGQVSRKLEGRTETVEDVLAQVPEKANLEASELNDRLQELVSENRLLELFGETRVAVGLAPPAKEGQEFYEAAARRAREYADIATQLDNLYRELVAPRVDQLRQLESQANQLVHILQRQSGDTGGEQQKNTNPNPLATSSPVARSDDLDSEDRTQQNMAAAAALQSALERGLRGAGLDSFADKLGDQFEPNSRELLGQVIEVQKEIRRRIQELILMEISVDRNSPVPPQYTELVDRYFRSLAEGTQP